MADTKTPAKQIANMLIYKEEIIFTIWLKTSGKRESHHEA